MNYVLLQTIITHTFIYFFAFTSSIRFGILIHAFAHTYTVLYLTIDSVLDL